MSTPNRPSPTRRQKPDSADERTSAIRLKPPIVWCVARVTCFSWWHTAGARRAGRPESLRPSSRLVSRPGQALCPGRRRGTAACPSPPGLAFSSLMAATTSPDSTVVSAHCASVRVFAATYLAVCSRHPRWGSPGLPSRPSTRRRARRSAGRTGTRRRAGRSGCERPGLVVALAPGPSTALESVPAVLIRRAAVSLHHSIDGDRDRIWFCSRVCRGRRAILGYFPGSASACGGSQPQPT